MMTIKQQRMWKFLIVAAVSLGITLSGISADRVALVIGVDNYDAGELPDLDGAIRDAEMMAETLKKLTPAFEVQLLKDPTMDDVFNAIDIFKGEAKRSDCVLFFFAGHGIEYHGENFLLTNDTNISDNIETTVESTKRRLRRTALSLNEVIDEMDLTEAALKLLVLDACRNNPIELKDGAKTRALGRTRGLAKVTAPLGMLVSYSADAGHEANDGLFTEVLTKNLSEPDLNVMEIFAKTRDEVHSISSKRNKEDPRYPTQLPAEYSKLSFSGIKFVFNPGGDAGPKDPVKPDPPVMPKNPPAPPSDPGGGNAPPDAPFKNTLGMQMVHVSAGQFDMGDNTGRGNLSELPVRSVELSPFHLGSTEVTQSQWKSITGESLSDLRKAAGFKGDKSYGEGPEHPVYYVSWEAATDFCRQLTAKERAESGLPRNYSYRLPTEAEWEYACRAGSRTPFAGDPFESGKIGGFGNADPVGQIEANGFGLHDMHGNVWEWCQDFYRPNYDGLTSKNPGGPTSGETRVFRGGSWLEAEHAARASTRGFGLPTLRQRTIGFRVALAKDEQ